MPSQMNIHNTCTYSILAPTNQFTISSKGYLMPKKKEKKDVLFRYYGRSREYRQCTPLSPPPPQNVGHLTSLIDNYAGNKEKK